MERCGKGVIVGTKGVEGAQGGKADNQEKSASVCFWISGAPIAFWCACGYLLQLWFSGATMAIGCSYG